MTKKQLIKKHGTINEFSDAVWNAYNNGVISLKEVLTGIQKYTSEYKAAK